MNLPGWTRPARSIWTTPARHSIRCPWSARTHAGSHADPGQSPRRQRAVAGEHACDRYRARPHAAITRCQPGRLRGRVHRECQRRDSYSRGGVSVSRRLAAGDDRGQSQLRQWSARGRAATTGRGRVVPLTAALRSADPRPWLTPARRPRRSRSPLSRTPPACAIAWAGA